MKNYKGRMFILGVFFLLMLSFSCSSTTDDNIGGDNRGTDNDSLPKTDILEGRQNLGVNFNEQLAYIDYDALLALRTKWVRGFVDFFQFYQDPSKISSDEGINKFLGLKTYGFNTVISLKFNFRGKTFPEPNSEEMDRQLIFLDRLLDRIWNKTDVIVVGNEPFIETDEEDQNKMMYDYYVAVSTHVKHYADEHGLKPIFFGSFDNMYQSRRQDSEVLNDLLTFSKETSWIDGVDMHIHHSSPMEMKTAIDFIGNRIRSNQKIMISEFSLMKHFRNNLNGTIPLEFAEKYGFTLSLKNYQYIDYALKTQVPREEWKDFLSRSPWFENRKNYLSNSFNDIFSTNDQFFLATYAFRQSYPPTQDFTGNTDPWVLNGLYANRTVEVDPDSGMFQFNYAWAKDFIAIQEK